MPPVRDLLHRRLFLFKERRERTAESALLFQFILAAQIDEVKQLAGSTVTLWFASGDESKWNAETLTYTDGDNSVKVKGAASVELKFGDDGFEQYDKLLSAGAFAEFTSQKIFEESGKGILASQS